MCGGKTAVRGVLGLAASLALVGCVGLGPSSPFKESAQAPTPRPRPSSDLQAGPELRIPGGSVARGPDIPLVPVPPPPLGRPAAPPPASEGSPVRPVAFTPPPAPPPPTGETPAPAPPPAAPVALTPRQLYQQAAAHYATMDSYIARLTRREMVKDKMQPEEVLLFKFRKAPWSVYFKWLGKEGQGREVLYVKDRYENKIHTLLAAGDVPFVPAGKRMAVALDNVFVRSASRHPITQAGIGASVERLGGLLRALERGDRTGGTLTGLGAVARPEFPRPIQMVEHLIPAGAEPALPRGGRRLYGFDPESALPVLVQTHDDRGQEVEYYLYDRLQYPVKLDNDDFDPDKLWARPLAPAGARSAPAARR